MLKELTKETLKESVKTVMADGFKTASAGAKAPILPPPSFWLRRPTCWMKRNTLPEVALLTAEQE